MNYYIESLHSYESNREFEEVFCQIIGNNPFKNKQQKTLKISWIATPLGPMLVAADEEALYLLKFVDRYSAKQEIEQIEKKTKCATVLGQTDPIESIEKELYEYFSGNVYNFQTPLFLIGSPFQKRVWEELRNIPHGETRSYAEIAIAIGNPSACRAVGLANGTNQFPVIIPCHRVINSSGELGGYGGGIRKKKWLLEHEKLGEKLTKKTHLGGRSSS